MNATITSCTLDFFQFVTFLFKPIYEACVALKNVTSFGLSHCKCEVTIVWMLALSALPWQLLERVLQSRRDVQQGCSHLMELFLAAWGALGMWAGMGQDPSPWWGEGGDSSKFWAGKRAF